jgi:tripartite-type tricarboxylate transporter receptor subunit TctC
MIHVLADPAVQKRFDELGIQISQAGQQTPDALRMFQKAETERWWPIIKAAGIKSE